MAPSHSPLRTRSVGGRTRRVQGSGAGGRQRLQRLLQAGGQGRRCTASLVAQKACILPITKPTICPALGTVLGYSEKSGSCPAPPTPNPNHLRGRPSHRRKQLVLLTREIPDLVQHLPHIRHHVIAIHVHLLQQAHKGTVPPLDKEERIQKQSGRRQQAKVGTEPLSRSRPLHRLAPRCPRACCSAHPPRHAARAARCAAPPGPPCC